jgi:CSLREA domain-containing protein
VRVRAAVTVVSICLLLGLSAEAQANAVINLGSMIPHGLNGHQDVVGDIVDPVDDSVPPHAALWHAGVLTRLVEPSGTTTSDANAIGATGRIAGEATVASGNYHALYWNGAFGAPGQLGPFPGSGSADFSHAEGLTADGQVAGATRDDVGGTGFLADPTTGATQKVGSANRDNGSTEVDGITPGGVALGQVTGAHNPDFTPNDAINGWYIWPSPSAGGTKLDLKPFQSGATFLDGETLPHFGNDLASDGSVLGYKGPDVVHGTFYVRTPDGAEQVVTGLDGHNGVNARHEVVGTKLVNDPTLGQTVHAMLWKPDGTVVDLNDLLPPNSTYILFDAIAINDNGDIAGVAGDFSTLQEFGFLMPAGYVVDSTGDADDTAPGDGSCLSSDGHCTLRAAIEEVSKGTSEAPTAISFELPGGATTIAPQTALPAITKPVAIDGTGNGGGQLLLEGGGAGSGAIGLQIEGDNSTVRGVKVQHFDGAGIRVQASNTLIGGVPSDTDPCTFPCNIVSDNTGSGIVVAGADNVNNRIVGNKLTGDARPALDLGGGGRTPNDKVDADTGPNGLHNFPIGVLAEADPLTGVTKISGVDVPDDLGETIDVYAQSSVDQARGAEPAFYVGSTKVKVTGGWSMDLPGDVPAADTFFSATVTGADGTSELSPICGDPDGDGKPDSDGDGICDDWELHGIDADDDGTIDLPLNDATYRADPGHKDVYLEVDAMQDNSQNIYAPQQGAIDLVVDAFAKAPVDNASGGTGVALHVNPGLGTVDDHVPEQTEMKGTGFGPGTLEYLRNASQDDPCDGYFGTATQRAAPDCFKKLEARALVFRYALFAYQYSEDKGSSGLATGIGGPTMTVTLGQWGNATVINAGGGISRCKVLDGCRRLVDAVSLMHELGHLLGLQHGGQEDQNFKPNYLSVMNYMYQFRLRAPERPLDYARFELPDLNENALAEDDGVLGAITDPSKRAEITGEWPTIAYYRPTVPAPGCTLHDQISSGGIDWDGDPHTDTSQVLLHSEDCTGARKILTSYDDWPLLRYSFRDQEGALTTPHAGDSATSEETSDQLLAQAASQDIDGNGVNDLADNCREVAGSGFADANANGFADVCEADMNRLQAFPSQANGAGAATVTPGSGPAAASGGGPAKDKTAPSLTKLSAHPTVARRAHGKHKAKPATLSFTVSEASTVTFTGELSHKGRKSGKRCVAGRKKGKSCVIYKKVGGSLRVNAKAGTQKVLFAGTLGAKKLGAGTYRLTAIAIDAAGNRSKPATVIVTVR